MSFGRSFTCVFYFGFIIHGLRKVNMHKVSACEYAQGNMQSMSTGFHRPVSQRLSEAQAMRLGKNRPIFR